MKVSEFLIPLGGGGSGTGLTTIEVSSNYTALSNYIILVNSSYNAIDITLPVSLVNGDMIEIADLTKHASTNNINILRNGHLINANASDFSIDVDGGSIQLAYSTLQNNFAILNQETLSTYYLNDVTAHLLKIDNSINNAVDITPLFYTKTAIDSSVVHKYGDTMTGNLTINASLFVNGRLGVGTTSFITRETSSGTAYTVGLAISPPGTPTFGMGLFEVPRFVFGGTNTAGNKINTAEIYVNNDNLTQGTESATMRIRTKPANAGMVTAIAIDSSQHVYPGNDAIQDLGSTALRWRTMYVTDLALKNNYGDWTIVEGEEDLFLYNNKKNKVYKFNLTEVDPSIAPPKNI